MYIHNITNIRTQVNLFQLEFSGEKLRSNEKKEKVSFEQKVPVQIGPPSNESACVQ